MASHFPWHEIKWMRPWGLGRETTEIKFGNKKMLERPQLWGSKGIKICQTGLRDGKIVLGSGDVSSRKDG